jgi:hypothetical protein
MDLKLVLSTGNGVRHRGQVISVFVSSSRNRLLNALLQFGHVIGNCVLFNKSIIESLLEKVLLCIGALVFITNRFPSPIHGEKASADQNRDDLQQLAVHRPPRTSRLACRFAETQID